MASIELILSRSKEDPSGCRLWTARVNFQGYAALWHDGMETAAHRVLYSLHHKVRLGRWDIVRHKCDNTLCVNIEHLELGTSELNNQDPSIRGRRSNTESSLNPVKIKEIRHKARFGMRYAQIAAEYQITEDYVGSIVRRQVWTNVI